MSEKQSKKVIRTPHIRTVRLGDCSVDREAQRIATDPSIRSLADDYNLDLLGIPVLSERDGQYWILDGQHRLLALKLVLGDDADDWTFQAEVYTGLSEAQEADMFIKLNKRKNVSAFDKFKVGVTAEYPIPTDINRIVNAHGLRVSQDNKQGSISATTALEFTYGLGGPKLLSSVLSTLSEAWDSAVWDSFIIKGTALFLNRYGNRINRKTLVRKLSDIPMAAKGLKLDANRIKQQTGVVLDKATAAAITNKYNKGLRGLSSLGNWFKSDQAAA